MSVIVMVVAVAVALTIASRHALLSVLREKVQNLGTAAAARHNAQGGEKNQKMTAEATHDPDDTERAAARQLQMQLQ
ncbi:MAG: hypothetical protein SGJ11_08995 [Phycisphaerae bacterium]|nr:hypothetical protein [Phycisphaerae bacterium]